MRKRYEKLFADLKNRSEGAYVPFVVLGDPNPIACVEIITALVESGADALELGLAFSDPIADGPTIQKANQRVLKAGLAVEDAWRLVSKVRGAYPDLPMGLLVYANLVGAENPDDFYARAAEAEIDSVLVADVPTIEARPYVAAARHHGICPVFIAYPWATERHLQEIARLSEGYTYLVTRSGVTGTDQQAQTEHKQVIERLIGYGAPPCLMGFGISKPEHVRRCMASGAAGAISGSAVVSLIEQQRNDMPCLLESLREMTLQMKKATKNVQGRDN